MYIDRFEAAVKTMPPTKQADLVPITRLAVSLFKSAHLTPWAHSFCTPEPFESESINETLSVLSTLSKSPASQAQKAVEAQNKPITWSKSLSSTRGLRFSEDSRTVTKTDDGPDYETAISEQVLLSGVDEVSFKMSRRVRAVKIGVCEDGFSRTGSDITDVDPSDKGYIVYSDRGTIHNRMGANRNSVSFESYSEGDTILMTVDFTSHKVTFKKPKKPAVVRGSKMILAVCRVLSFSRMRLD